MSLIGSLEDLSLGDILQIISLLRKSGVLVLRTNDGDGRIVFRAGSVCSAVAKGGPSDLRGVLVGGGYVREADFDAAQTTAHQQARELSEVLVEAGPVSADRLDSLLREAVEDAVVSMFRWRVGDFSFDVREASEAEDPVLMLPTGVNAQYLAMEGARRADEDDDGAGAASPAELDDMSAHEMFGVEPEPTESSEPRGALDVVVEAALESRKDAEQAESLEATPAAPVEEASDPMRPVIAIDCDLPALEWTKAALVSHCERVHIFQRPDLGLARIRQYLARAVAPIVLLSPATPGDRLSGIADAEDFVRRLKRQAPLIRVVWLQEDGVVAVGEPGTADAIAIRPASHQLRSGVAADPSGRLAEQLRDLVASLGRGRSVPEASPNLSGDALDGLQQATSRLREASMRAEVLAVVIDSAAQLFRRVAMLMVRDGTVTGIAQHQLSVCGGPDDDGLRRFEMPIEDSQWLRRVLADRAPIRSAPDGEGDLRLAAALGDRPAAEAYLAPIERSGRVVAIIYGDDLPGGGSASDSSALEVVLHHAGLALDRTAQQRALDCDSG